MTTPTTNYGWLKPDPSEAADIRVINTLLDDMDADIKAVQDSLSSNIYPLGQYRLMKKEGLAGGGTVSLITSTEPDLWSEDWYVPGNTGAWTFPSTGKFQFTAAGIYRVHYSFTIPTITQAVTSGYSSIGIYDLSSNQVKRAKVYTRSNTTDNVTNFTRTTLLGSVYVWAASGSDQCLLNTEYAIGIQQHTTSGTIQMNFTPNDILPFTAQVTLECVRGL